MRGNESSYKIEVGCMIFYFPAKTAEPKTSEESESLGAPE